MDKSPAVVGGCWEGKFCQIRKEEFAMRKCIAVCSLAFLGMVCLSGSVLAQPPIYLECNMFKTIIPLDPTEWYGLKYEAGGEGIKKVILRIPKGKKGKKLRVNTPLNTYHSEFTQELVGGQYEEFRKKFPEGKYVATVRLKGGRSQKFRFRMTHDFPDMPVITYPTNGATDVPLTFTIQWQTLSGIDGLKLEIEDDLDFAIVLPVDSTSFTLPSGILQPNTTYWLGLRTWIYGADPNVEIANSATRWIRFTTVSQ